jgi:hypothetical protein
VTQIIPGHQVVVIMGAVFQAPTEQYSTPADTRIGGGTITAVEKPVTAALKHSDRRAQEMPNLIARRHFETVGFLERAGAARQD